MIRREVWLALGLALTAAAAPASEVPGSPTEVAPLDVGQQVPDVTLRTPDGEPFALRAAVEKQRTVLIFYRGGW